METNEYVRMTYSFQKKGRQVTVLSSDSVKNPDICESDLDATHVVTEIKYGFNSFMIFESQVTNTSSVTQLSGSLQSAVEMVASILPGSSDPEWTDEIEEVASSLKFKFHGDTIIDPPPQTYEDAINVYKLLPERSIIDERVVSFSLTPLSDYCEEFNPVVIDISDGIIESASNIVVDFETVDKEMRKLKSYNLPLDFQRYRAVLLDLEERFEEFKSNITSKMQTMLPLVRSGQADEGELAELIRQYNDSPYEREMFLGLLGTRQKEIETAEYIIYHPDLPSNKFIDLDHTGDMSKCIIGHDYALVYELEIIPQNITNLGDMYESGSLNEGSKWFMDEGQVGENRPLLYDFIQLAKKNEDAGSASICFLISLNQIGESQKAFQLKLLKSGTTIVEGFRAPQKIRKMDEIEIGVDHVQLRVHHEADTDLELNSSYFELKTAYELISEDVSILPGDQTLY